MSWAKTEKFSENSGTSRSRAHSIVRASKNSISPFGSPARRRIEASERPPVAGTGTRWMKPPTWPSSRSATAISASGMREEAVHRHREAALGPAAAPLLRDRAKFVRKPRLDVPNLDHARAIALALEPRDGLPHLADRPSLEREVARDHDRLVPEVDRLEAHGRVERKQPLARREDGRSPAAGLGDPPKLRHELARFGRVSDRVAADQRDSMQDAVREERVPGGREEVALVVAQREERQRVEAGIADDAPGLGARPGLVLQVRGDRAKPEVEGAEDERAEEDSECVSDALGQVDRPRCVGRQNSDDRAERQERVDQGPDRFAASLDRECPPVGEQGSQHGQARRGLLDVEPLDQVRDGRPGHEHDGELPGAAFSPRQREGKPEQCDPESERHRSREVHRAFRKGSADDLRARGEGRSQRRRDADARDESCRDGEYFFGGDDATRKLPKGSASTAKGPVWPEAAWARSRSGCGAFSSPGRRGSRSAFPRATCRRTGT